ncbi:hypothetical protein D3C78_1339260 [compost metagenome]
MNLLRGRRLFDHAQRVYAPAPVFPPRALVVRDDDRHFGPAPGFEGFLQRFHDEVVFVTHVSGVYPAGVAGFLCQFYEFVHFGRAGRLVVQAGGQARGTFCQRLAQYRAHLLCFFCACWAIQIIHDGYAQGGMPD